MTSGDENVEKRNPWYTAGAVIMESSMEFPQKLNMELPFDPVIPLLGIYPKRPKTPIRKNICTPMFIAVQFIMARI